MRDGKRRRMAFVIAAASAPPEIALDDEDIVASDAP